VQQPGRRSAAAGAANPPAPRAFNGQTPVEPLASGRTRQQHDHASAGVLTPEEHEIALMAAAGMSNKQIGERLFSSHRTVGTHLYRVFLKLGITSRAALRDALADQLGAPDQRPRAI
jgi:DNA-binding NarL/FixJ family response regulator